ncbi:AraC family transcriptional regulator [Mesorhizobium sp. SB112]|uniref:helix-turn-helix transcriptional regulator n=1 Tax=Mesorhizobium sp. SB112 TaxID=3151853 RepID=UPI0032646E59
MIAGRKALDSHGFRWRGIEFVLATEDIRELTTWQLKPDFHSLVVHLDGTLATFESEVENGPVKIGPPRIGEIWIVPAAATYAAKARGAAVRYAEMRLPPDAMSRLTGQAVSIEEIPPLLGIRDELIIACMRRLADLSERTDDVSTMFGEHLVAALCHHVFATYSAGGEALEIGDASAISPAMAALLREYIQDRLNKRIRLEELASLTGMAPKPFLKAFRRAFGTTPGQYVIDKRVENARALLADTSLTITEIALMTGFSHHAHLTRTFSGRLGTPPSRYRHLLRS